MPSMVSSCHVAFTQTAPRLACCQPRDVRVVAAIIADVLAANRNMNLFIEAPFRWCLRDLPGRHRRQVRGRDRDAGDAGGGRGGRHDAGTDPDGAGGEPQSFRRLGRMRATTSLSLADLRKRASPLAIRASACSGRRLESVVGQLRHFGCRPTTSGLLLETDIVRAARHVSESPTANLVFDETL